MAIVMENAAKPYQAFLQILLDKNKLSANELKKVERMQKSSVAESLPHLLVKLGLCSEHDVADAFVESGDFEKILTGDYPLEAPLPESVSLRFLKNFHVIGIGGNDDEARVAMMDP